MGSGEGGGGGLGLYKVGAYLLFWPHGGGNLFGGGSLLEHGHLFKDIWYNIACPEWYTSYILMWLSSEAVINS